MHNSGTITGFEHDTQTMIIERAVYFSHRFDEYEVQKKITQNVKKFSREDEFPSMVDKIRFRNNGGDFTVWFSVRYN